MGFFLRLACPTGIEPVTHSLEGCCSIQLSYGQMIETTQHVLGCWEMLDWREVNPRPSLILSGPQGGGVESVRFFTSPTTRQRLVQHHTRGFIAESRASMACGCGLFASN